jgi:hypothetical protein
VAAVLFARAVIRSALVHLDPVERAVAGLLTGTGALLLVHLVPLALGILSQGTVLAASALLALGSLALPPAVEPGEPDPPRPPAPSSSQLSWLLAGGAAAAAGVWALANVREWISRPLQGVDTLTFHLPNVARWMESGSLWQIDQFLPLQAQGYYPNHGDLLLLWGLLPWHNDFFVRVPMVALLAAFGFALWAMGRELGAPPATRLAVAAGLCSLPILANSTIRTAMPDVLLAFALACSGLFLLRYARTLRTSDLVLGGLGLGIALGTKWYGLPVVVIVVGVVLVARRSLRDGAILGGVATAAGGIWMVRNIVEVGNPFFPLDTPVFDAPRDTVTERVGFSISDYLGDGDVLLHQLPGEIVQGLGYIAIALGLAALPGVVRMARGAREGRVVALLAVALGLAVAYVLTPNTALGLKGDPSQANFNTRYAIPALIACAGVAMWGAGRVPRLAPAVEAVLAAAVLLALGDAFTPAPAKSLVLAAVVLGGGAAAVLVLRGRPRLVLAGAGALAVAALVAYGDRQQERLNDGRYADASEPVLATIAKADAAPGDLRVAIAGDWNANGLSPVWPSFGKHVTNEVTTIGYDDDGFLTNYADASGFVAALRREHPDALVVGRGLAPRNGVVAKEERWAAEAGWREIARSDRLVLYAPPA